MRCCRVDDDMVGVPMNITMPKTWGDWTKVITGTAGVALIGVASYKHFTTDVEAQVQHIQLAQQTTAVADKHNQYEADAVDIADRAEIGRATRSRIEIKRKLRNPNLATWDRESLEESDESYKEVIDCIKAQQKYCY